MIIVTGEPRSGTSLMMETLRLLGTMVWGQEQFEKKSGSELESQLHTEKAKWMNEKFWEVGGVVMQGIQLQSARINRRRAEQGPWTEEHRKRQLKHFDAYIDNVLKHQDSAVKIIWNGLTKTDRDILDNSKIILCLRHPLHIAQSQTNLQSPARMAISVENENAFVSPKMPISPMRYLRSCSNFLRWMSLPINKNLKILKVDYDDMINDKVNTIHKITQFISDEPVDPHVLLRAAMNIDPQKRRNALSEAPDDSEEWLLVEEGYECVKSGNYELFLSRIDAYDEFQKTNPENARWLDEETFFPIDVPLYRSMQNKPEMKQGMLESKQKRQRKRFLCASCPLYNREGPAYTVRLPDDLEDITRNKVDCAALGEMTIEECQNHWQKIKDDPKWLNKLESLAQES